MGGYIPICPYIPFEVYKFLFSICSTSLAGARQFEAAGKAVDGNEVKTWPWTKMYGLFTHKERERERERQRERERERDIYIYLYIL